MKLTPLGLQRRILGRPHWGNCRAFEVPYSVALLRLLGKPSQLHRKLLIFFSRASTHDIGNSYRSKGHKILGKMACWYTHALNRPGSPDLFTLASQSSRSLLVFWMAALSFELWPNSFPRLLTGCSNSVGMVVPEMVNLNLSTALPFLITRDLDFDGL